MRTIVVGIADCAVSNDPDAVLVTHALGSCIGLLIHDPVASVGGLLHYMLPESRLDAERAQRNPFLFADTGIPELFRRAYALGAVKNRLVVRAVGAAQVMDPDGIFHIGKRNCQALRRILWKAGILLDGGELGGFSSRTVRLEVGTGRMWCRSAGEPEREMTGSIRLAQGVVQWRTAF
ncbi:MAG: chemotaxis protein CheD [Bryobacteraceae bacterium]